MSDDPNYNRLKPEDRLGDGPLEKQYRQRLLALAQVIDEAFNRDLNNKSIGFVLLLFPFGTATGRRCNYISNGANREDIVVLMKEMIARFEGQPELKGTA